MMELEGTKLISFAVNSFLIHELKFPVDIVWQLANCWIVTYNFKYFIYDGTFWHNDLGLDFEFNGLIFGVLVFFLYLIYILASHRRNMKQLVLS